MERIATYTKINKFVRDELKKDAEKKNRSLSQLIEVICIEYIERLRAERKDPREKK